MDRREFLYGLNASLGSIAFSAMLSDELDAAPNQVKQPHFPQAKAKHCIFLYMEGGPSHIDNFDPKSKLIDLHEQEFNRSGERQSAMSSGKRYYVKSPFEFRKAGESGADMNTNWEHLARVADDICFYRGLQVTSVNHPTANYHVNTGNRFGGDPAIGAWVNYGLGSPNKNFPGFVVLPELSFPQGGPSNWNNGFLPTRFQGTTFRPSGSPILDIEPVKGMTTRRQRNNLDLLKVLNRRHSQKHPQHDQLVARMENYELAYLMQSEIPDLMDLDDETVHAHNLYGIGEPETDNFGKRCLLARKLVENGVRFVQVYASTWDSHDYIERAHGSLIKRVDKPIAGLLQDLKERGLLESTLVIWMGEFGRTPDNGIRGGIKYGRDHNPNAMAVWMAGGGVKAGHTIGATDELGMEAVEVVHPLRDLHVTILKLMGLDDNKLTYFHSGRYKQLSQFGGEVINELIA